MITSGELYKVKIALHKLGLYCQENSLQVDVRKTEAMKFRNGGRFRNVDRLCYLGEEIEFVNAFCYLGITLSTQNVATHHHKIREEKGIQQVNHLAAKVDLQIINFATAETRLDSVILPSATYGLSDFIKEPDFLKSVIGYFWKRWARISKYTSTTPLLEHLFNQD